MYKKYGRIFFSALLLALIILPSAALVSAQEQTEVGTPRATTLIVDNLGGRVNNPTQTNPYQAGTHQSAGLHQLVY
ncbi:MAG: hypothetical protein OXG60_11825, partial [Chloroflexi bacterium]|nr:hypothetical protein [Chloroflexota bacterium]